MIGFSGWSELLALGGVALMSLALALALADLLYLSRIRLEVNRICEEKLSLGAQNPVRIELRNLSYASIRGSLRDEYPVGLEAEGNVISFEIPARSEREYEYSVPPNRRGDYEFGDIYVRFFGPLRMLYRQVKCPAKSHTRVYPNLLDIRRYELSLRRDNALQPGRRLVKSRGMGTEFESLRDYAPDDDFRSIDWKASARRRKLVSKIFQEEKSQNVLIVLDCGRVMGQVIDGLSKLDHCINAAMLLAYAASRKGDRVGLMVFGEDVLNYSHPKSGKSQALNLLRLAYKLKEAEEDSNYFRAIPYLMRRLTRRSLIVFFTDIVDAESSKPLISHIAALSRKHLCMCITMSDPAVNNAACGSPDVPADPYLSAAARQSIHSRKQAAAQLMRAGAIVLDIPPEQFSPMVVNEYLNVKNRGKL